MKVQKTTTLWIISYILVLILPIVSNFVTYASVENMMLSQVVRNNRYIVEGKMASIDSLLDGIIEISLACVNDEMLIDFAKIAQPVTPLNKYEMSRFSKRWNAAKNTVGVDSIYVYMPNSDFIMGTNAINTPRLFYIANYGSEDGFDTWYSFISDWSGSEFKMLSAGGSQKLIYVSSRVNSDLVAVVEVDTKKLAQALTDIDGSFYVFDDSENLVVSTGSAEALEVVKSIGRQTHDDYLNIEAGDEKLTATSVKSGKSQWRYVYAVDRSKYMRSITSSRVINYFGIGVSVLLGIILIAVSVRKNHKPLEKLVEQLQKGSERVRDDPDDYRYMSQLINSTITEKNEMRTAMSFQQKALRDSVLSKLLKGSDREKDIKALIDSFDIRFPYKNFLVGVIYIDDVSEMFFETGGDDEEKFKQAQFVIGNVLEELLNQYFCAYVFKCDNLLCLIMNCENYTKEDEQCFYGCIKETYGFAGKNFNFSFISAVSDCVLGLENICVAYDKAIEVLEYKFVIDDENILTPQEIEKSRSGDYYYPIHKEQNIINSVKNGDYEGALSILDEVLDKNFAHGNMSGQLAKCFIFDILCTIIKSVNEINADAEYLEGLNLYSRITECATVAAMREELIAVLRRICGNIDSNNKRGNHIIDRVVEFVEENYRNENLSVALIAEKCGTTPNYLSLIFKQKMSVGLLEYISEYRIGKAKMILNSNANVGIEDVAKNVGYSNVRTFSRVFRKYEGITPAKYRQNLM